MKVCFFPHFSFSNRDGAILSMYNIIDEMLERGIEIVVVLPNQNNLEERLKDTRIKFYHVPMYSLRMTVDKMTALSELKFAVKYVHNISCVNKIAQILKEENIDYIHINGLDSPVGALVAKKLNIPYVWHIRQFMGEDLGKKLFAQEKTYKLVTESNVVIGISKDVQMKFEKELGRPVEVIYNGIPQEQYEIKNRNILNEDQVKMLLAGRISVQKGQMIAVEAIENLLKENVDNVHLTLVGQGETREYLEFVKRYIAEHNLASNISLLEHTDDLRELRSTHDIGLTTSQKEAFGRVTVENMMADMLVIAANSGGTLEIIDDGENGLLYEVDNPISLAQKIKYAVENRQLMKSIAQKGYEDSIEKYSIKRVVDEILKEYERSK